MYTFMVDTGADVSIIKISTLNTNHYINSRNACSIKGITANQTYTLGTTNLSITTEGAQVPCTFQVVDDLLPIPTDGILGRDFLTKYRCEINYDNWLLSFNFENNTLSIPIYDNLNGAFVIPARSEAIRHLSGINLPEDALVEGAEIAPGIFVANTIVSKQSPCVRFVNTTTQDVLIRGYAPKILLLKNFNLIKDKTNFNKSRIRNLHNSLNITNVPEFAKEQLLGLCEEFNEIFHLEEDKLTYNNFYKQKIRVNDFNPVYIKNYKTPHCQKEEISRQIGKLIEQDIIEPSVSEYNSPLLLVPKKSTDEKKWRLVVDYRQLNKKLLADKFPLPRIDDILDQLGRAKFFSTLDLMSGFHQIQIDEKSRKYTAFSYPEKGHFQFKRLPFGLNISPNSFQRMMSIALSGLSPECAFLYIDDIIVIGCSVNQHLKNLRKVFECMRRKNLKLNPSKCCFFQSEVIFLGHQVTDNGILPDKSKFEIVMNYPIPQNADQVRSFVAFCNYYRRFIPDFAFLCIPLNKLLRKNEPFVWTENCQQSFDNLKSTLLKPTILQYPDFEKTFILTTDASDFACGAVLSQNFDTNDLPISFASRTFTKGEANKHIIEKELAAIHWAIMHFRSYLYGRKFVVRTDHRPLIYLFGMKNPSSKLTRMRLDLEEFDFEIEFVPGKSNVVADALSRIMLDSNKLKEMTMLQVQTRSMQSKSSLANNSSNENEVQTGSMLNKSSLANTNGKIEIRKPDQLRVFESINNEEIYKLRKIMFTLKRNHKRPAGELSIYQTNYKSRLTLALDLEFSYKNLPNIFTIIEQYTRNNNINKNADQRLALPMNDDIFKFVDINDFKNLGNKILKNTVITLYKPAKTITNINEINNILKQSHDTPIGGHVGINRLYRKLKNIYTWNDMKRSITKFVKSCEVCKLNKHYNTVKEKFVKTSTPHETFDIVSIDTIGPFTLTEDGNRYAITMQCDLSKYLIIVPIPNKSAETIAKAIVEHCILIYGPMSAIRTDQGTEYKGIFDHVCNELQINHTCSTAYHPQSIGAVERNHRCLNEYLRIFINDRRNDWDKWLPFYTYCYNTTPNTHHAYSPFEILFGKAVKQFENTKLNIVNPVYNYDSYITELKFKLQVIHKHIFDKIEREKLHRTNKANEQVIATNINIGDTVYLKAEGRSKLDKVQLGPYYITRMTNSNAEILCPIKNQTTIVHKNRLVKFNQ